MVAPQVGDHITFTVEVAPVQGAFTAQTYRILGYTSYGSTKCNVWLQTAGVSGGGAPTIIFLPSMSVGGSAATL
jgi:hypothetical protein